MKIHAIIKYERLIGPDTWDMRTAVIDVDEMETIHSVLSRANIVANKDVRNIELVVQ